MDPIWVITQPFERPQTIYGFTPDTPLLHDTHALVKHLAGRGTLCGAGTLVMGWQFRREKEKRYQKPYCSSFYTYFFNFKQKEHTMIYYDMICHSSYHSYIGCVNSCIYTHWLFFPWEPHQMVRIMGDFTNKTCGILGIFHGVSLVNLLG